MITRMIIVALILLPVTSFAYFSEIVTDKTSMSFAINGQGKNQSGSITAVIPYKKLGYGAIFAQRQTADDAVISEVLAAKLQGGFNIDKVQVRLVVEGERDTYRNISFGRTISYFISPPYLKIGDAKFRSGFGNYTENISILETLGKDVTDTNFGWTAFIAMRWKNITSTLKTEPEFDFNRIKSEWNASIAHDLSDDFSIGTTLVLMYDSLPYHNEEFHTQYMLFARWVR